MGRQANTTHVVNFRCSDEQAELARLARLTGLRFESVPVSLVNPGPAPAPNPEPAAFVHRAPPLALVPRRV